MKTSTAILLVGAAAVVAFVVLRRKDTAPSVQRPSAVASAFDFGKTLVARYG